MEDKLEVLIIGELDKKLAAIGDNLSKFHWIPNLCSFDDEGTALKLIESSAAGVVLFCEESIGKLDKIEFIISKSTFEWIAIIPKSLLECKKTSLAIRKAFYAYQEPSEDYSQLSCIISHAQKISSLGVTGNNQALDHAKFDMVGESSEMKRVHKIIERVSTVDAPVFISGESGTGKELAAQSIHAMSKRSHGPFIAVNCGALPPELIQSELFGHEKGSFTSANHRKIGKIEAASGGTLFLDEVGDLPLDMQVNLLRFLEDHKIQRVGSVEEIHVDVRVLAATHVDLEKAVKNGEFREDLYHRLNVLQVFMPSLRERVEDIEKLSNYFFKKYLGEKTGRVKGFSKESLERMKGYAWPGNIRELMNRIRRAMVMCDGRLIQPDDLGLERRQCFRQPMTLEEARDRAEMELIKASLTRNKNNIQKASNELGVARVTLYRLIDKHQISREVHQEKVDERISQVVSNALIDRISKMRN